MRRAIPGTSCTRASPCCRRDPSQAEYLYDRLLTASPAELPVIWGILREHDHEAPPRLWKLLEDRRPTPKSASARRARSPAPIQPRAIKDGKLVATFIADHFLTAVIKNPGDYAGADRDPAPAARRLCSGRSR